MTEKTIEQQIKDKYDELAQIHSVMAVRLLMDHPPAKIAKINDLQHRLEFRLKQHELNLVTEKVAIFSDVLDILKP